MQVGGAGPAFQEVNENVESDLVTAELIAFPLLFVVSLIVFRSAVAALLPLLVGGLTIVTSLLILRGVNEVVDISIFALNLITGLGLGLAIDYSLFMVSRYREELERVGPGAEAIRRTVATAGRTVAFSALTVAGAGLALLVFPLRFLYSMGVGVTIVALAAAAVSLDRPARTVRGAASTGSTRSPPSAGSARRLAESRAEARGFWYRLSKFVMRFPVGTAVAGAAILLALGAPFLGVKFTGVDATVLPDGSAARAVDQTLRTRLRGGRVLARWSSRSRRHEADAERIAAYADELTTLPGAAEVVRAALPRRRDLAGRRRAVRGHARRADARPGRRGPRRPRARAPPTSAGRVPSRSTRSPRSLRTSRWLWRSCASLTLVTLFMLTGSVILPIKALIMNVLTISATFGILVLIFQDGRFEGLLDFTSQGALESTQPVFLFAIVFGLSTDYAVFLLTRIKEARDHGAGEREAVALGLQRTGRIVTAAAISVRDRAGRVRDLADHLHQAARHRHGAGGADRRDDRARDARPVAHGAARQGQLVGTRTAAPVPRPLRRQRVRPGPHAPPPRRGGALASTRTRILDASAPPTGRLAGQDWRKAITALTRRLELSSSGSRSSFMKMLLVCLLMAFSVTNSADAIAVLDRP